MLYQWEVGRLSMFEVRQTFWLHHADSREPLPEGLRGFAMMLADGVAARIEELDPIIAEAAEHWRLERMNVMDRLILRLAVYEFLHEPGTPAKVVINEALELARSFSGDEAVRFINGILDAIRRKLERE
jgi:N utilization substance protein B